MLLSCWRSIQEAIFTRSRRGDALAVCTESGAHEASHENQNPRGAWKSSSAVVPVVMMVKLAVEVVAADKKLGRWPGCDVSRDCCQSTNSTYTM